MAMILIVDDDPDIGELLSVRLKANGYDAEVASDAIQAVGKAYELKPDLVLLDYMLPGGDGIAVFEKLKTSEFTKDTPVIFITAHATENIREQALGMGATDFITKPFNATELIEKIKKALGEKPEET